MVVEIEVREELPMGQVDLQPVLHQKATTLGRGLLRPILAMVEKCSGLQRGVQVRCPLCMSWGAGDLWTYGGTNGGYVLSLLPVSEHLQGRHAQELYG